MADIYGTSSNDTLSGTSDNDNIYGLAGNDVLNGDAGDDVLDGGTGADQLSGDAGNDVFNGGAGNDVLQDWSGNDTYIFGVGSGQDTVNDMGVPGEIDAVQVLSGVTPTTLFVTQDFASNFGAWTLRLAHSDDQFIIQNFNSIEQIQFADGTVWDQATIQARLQQVQTGTASNDFLSGSFQGDYLQGLAGNDTLYAGDGHDALMGGAGNDTLQGDAGDDVFNGGVGNDVLQDWSGNDTYIFGVGSGTDTVQDWGAFNETDTVQLTNGITPGTLLVTQDFATNPGGLTLRLAHSDDQLLIQGFNPIEQIQFADETVWDQATIQARVQQVQTGTEANDFLSGFGFNNYLEGRGGDDILYGTSGIDALLGGQGNDQLYSGMGDDVLNGGSGNDQLSGDMGSDTYVWGVGSGTDTVQDWGAFNETDTVFVTNSITPGTLLVTQGGAENPGGLTLRLAQSDDQLLLQGFNPIEQIQFADGTVWDRATIQARVQQVQIGTAGSDFLSGGAFHNYLDGQAGDDNLSGNNGHDALIGGAGNDQLAGGAGNDVYNGGTGNDSLQDFAGNDTYIFGMGSGQDTVQDWGVPNETDTVQLTGGVSPATLLVSQNNFGGLTLRLAQSDDQFIIQSFNSIEQIQFADGTVWDQATIQARVQQVQIGTEANDFLSGFGLNNYLEGRGGDDTLYGTSGIDALLGGQGNDQLYSGMGDDVLNGGSGNDQLYGDLGNDTYIFGVGSGTDTVQDWGMFNETDTVYVTSGVTPATLLVTQDFSTNPGGLTLRVAHTADQFIIQNFNAMEQIQFADGTVWDQATIQARVQQVQTGTAGNDFLSGGALHNYLDGQAGDDNLSGNNGHDALIGGAGNDQFAGGAGDDVYNGGTGNDVLQDWSGSDTYIFGVGSGMDTVQDWGAFNETDTVYITSSVTPATLLVTQDFATNPGGLTLRVAHTADQFIIQNFNSIEQIQFADGTVWDQAMIQAQTVQVQMTGTEGNDTLVGVASHDVLQGFGGDDLLNGMDGDDVLDGGSGLDTLIGGAGSDRFIVDDPGDVVTENLNEGIDTVESSVSHTLAAHVEHLTLTGAASVNGTGNELANVLIGNDGNNVLAGGDGADVLEGGIGDDQYVVETAGDMIVERAGEGVDTVTSAVDFILGDNLEHLTLTGTEALTATGNAADNHLVGNAVDNLLDGSFGFDTMSGGMGNDTYIVDSYYDVVIEQSDAGIDTVRSSANHTLSSNVENLILTSNESQQGTGNSLDNVLIGNNFTNTLDGSLGADTMVGLQGDDSYIVDNIGDVVTEQLNEGTDTVRSTVTYALGANVEYLILTEAQSIDGIGNELDNVLQGNDEANGLSGGQGNDSIIGGGGADVITGGEGNDLLSGENGSFLNGEGDTINGGEGDDTLYGENGVFNAGGNDVLHGGMGNDFLTGENGIYTVGGNDQLFGEEGNDTLSGGGGNDLLDGGTGVDVMAGSLGGDTYIVGEVGDTVTENANEGTDLVNASISYVLGANVENVTLTGTAAINGTGNGLNNVLTGNSVANILDGSAGADTMMGGLGDDTYIVDNAGDVVTENANEGTDLVSSSISYVLGANVENLLLTGTAAINGTGNSVNNVLTGNSAANVLDGAAGADSMTGGQGDDTYVVENVGDTVTETANEGLDTVQSSITYTLGANVENLTLTGAAAINGTGNALDNILTGNSAANVLTGGAGNDTYVIGAGDSIVEAAGGGTDTVQSALTYTLGSNLENLTLTGSSAVNGTGNSLANILTGNSAANVLSGGTGNDTYVVGAGDAITESNNGGTDTVQSSVTWTLGSNLENLMLTGSSAINGTGNSANNVMTGNSAANVLSGANGNDTLRGGLGNDTVNGGGGNDTYLFGRGEGQDLVQDNSGSVDKILYDAGINPLDLVISRQANDLRLSIHGSTDYVSVQNWYTSSSNRTETIQAGNGQTLLSTQVDQLIQAMASFSQQTGLTWDQAIDQQPQQVQNILAASWQ